MTSHARRRLLPALLVTAAVLTSLAVPSGGMAAAAAGDSAAIGDVFTSSSISSGSGYKRFPAGPDTGAPTTAVDAAAHTVDVIIDDAGRRSVATMAWPARTGTWSLAVDGTEPEQHVMLRRGTASCTLTAGTLEVRQAVADADGGVAALTADVRTGSCSLGSNVGGYAGLAIRIGGSEPLPGVGRAEPALVDTGAVQGTVVSQRVVVTNVGGSPWQVRRTGTGSTNSWGPLFTVVPGSDTCTGATLAVGAHCEVTVSTTAPNYFIGEHLIVAGNGAADVVVPLRLEGFPPVPAPTGVTSVAGRLGATLSWNAPVSDPRVGYRVYDVAGGARTLVATAAPTARTVSVPGRGPRSLALVAAEGRFAESPDVPVQTPEVTREIVAMDHYGYAVGFAEPAAGTTAAGRQSSLDWYLRLDPSRTAWVRASADGVRVCSVDREVCTTVAGVDPSGSAGQPKEAVWLPDGRIAFLAQGSSSLGLWVVGRDGAGLRQVRALPSPDYPGYAQLAAAPDGTQVLVRGGRDLAVVRVRLSDGLMTTVPGTGDVDDFTVTTAGRLVLQRRLDLSQSDGPTRISVTALDGSGSRDLALPAGDNREVTFDPSGSRLAFVRHTSAWEGTVWTAAADGSGARQVSDRSAAWLDIQWSADDAADPVATITGPAVSGAAVSLSVGAGDADDQVGGLRRECRLDGAATWSACGSTWALGGLSAGVHTAYARVTDPSGRTSATVSRSWTVDRSAPTTSVSALAPVQTRLTPTLSWRSTDTGGAGLASYDIRMRRASPYGGWSGYLYPTTWQKRTSPSLALSLAAGYQYCFSVRANDKAGNVGTWSAQQCTTVTLDDRSMSASSGWTRGTSSYYAFGTWTRAARTGVSLTRTSVQGRRIGLVVATCSTCGVVDVYHAGVKVGRVSLYSSRTAYRQVRWLTLQSVTRKGTVTVRTVNSRSVYLDGIAVQH